MKISVQAAEKLADDVLLKLGYKAEDASIIRAHLIDSELRGYTIAGLARILSIAERLGSKAPAAQITINAETPTSAQINGNDTLGYLVAYAATRMAITKAKANGVAVVGANNTYYTGMLSYYAEQAAADQLVSIIASNGTPWVAPHGTYKGLVGTNPFCIGVPTDEVPIIHDIGTSKIIHAQVMLAKRKGEQLPPDTAFDEHGNTTADPEKALRGSLDAWGAAKGSGLAIAVQLLGILAGSPALPGNLEDFGFFIMVIDPARFRPMQDFKREVNRLVEAFHTAPSRVESSKLRLPFERSFERRAAIRADGYLEGDDIIIDQLRQLAAKM